MLETRHFIQMNRKILEKRSFTSMNRRDQVRNMDWFLHYIINFTMLSIIRVSTNIRVLTIISSRSSCSFPKLTSLSVLLFFKLLPNFPKSVANFQKYCFTIYILNNQMKARIIRDYLTCDKIYPSIISTYYSIPLSLPVTTTIT